MTANSAKVLEEALELPPIDRAELVEQILRSFELKNNESIDSLWAKEAEDRINAYDRGEISSASAKDVFNHIR
jgi:putative addiction module component (TIGR02574 family)